MLALRALLYLLFSAACLKVLPFDSVANSQHVASDVVERVIGHGVAFWITLAMALSALGSMNSSILSGARVPYAMARDRIFFHVADGIHPKYRTPGRALIFQVTLTSLMALTGTFEELTNLFIFAAWIFYGLAVVALFRLRKARTQPRPPLSLLGLSLGPRSLRYRLHRLNDKSLARPPRPLHHRPPPHPRGPPLLPLLDATRQYKTDSKVAAFQGVHFKVNNRPPSKSEQ